ncbi:hypothetical protein M378DRAFT_745571 [Amanita muscaria Koide BX008]|uniref:Aip3p/Bud6 N-terminal domain-containing protein n=1 Tax=Amanita muscaria (strain Koide BX008) TaxID=946122 RepID=A0A0C2X2A6_AMAMK|nr:hypothetical protein M378DRAFT_745571 [Amanita muscaria Koide BX008]
MSLAQSPSVPPTQSPIRRSERATRRNVVFNTSAVESAVTNLLVSIKQLLESLTEWSQLKIDETAVSDVYVRLGNNFNVVKAMFAAYNIDLSDLLTFPDDLRNVLEQCLAEEATPENLDIYYPTVRQLITNLLQRLKKKQARYRRIVSRSAGKVDHERSGRDRDRDTPVIPSSPLTAASLEDLEDKSDVGGNTSRVDVVHNESQNTTRRSQSPPSSSEFSPVIPFIDLEALEDNSAGNTSAVPIDRHNSQNIDQKADFNIQEIWKFSLILAFLVLMCFAGE